MTLSCARLLAISALLALTVTSCGGGAPKTTPPQPDKPASVGDAGVSPSSSATVPLSSAGGTFALPLGDGYRGKITVRGTRVPAGSTMTLESTSTTSSERSTQSQRPCPNIPPIRLKNPFDFPLEIDIDEFEIDLPCNINGKLFAVGVYQLKPTPTVLTVVKIGDAKGVEDELKFTPTVKELTLPPRSTEVVLFSPETTTSGVPIPVVPGVTTVLTAGNAKVPTTLSFKFGSASGGSVFTSSCDNAFNGETLNPELQGVPLVGTPSFFCHLDPGSTSITFSASPNPAINFYIGNPKPDASVLGLDGPTSTFLCQTAPSTTTCGTPTFTISNTSSTAFKNVVVANAEDMRMCVPVTDQTDCNRAVDPAPSRTTVTTDRWFEVLVADDPTYRPGVGPWDGKFRPHLDGPCTLPDTTTTAATRKTANVVLTPSPAPSSSSGLPGYTDVDQQGIGPKAEFDVIPLGPGVCTITMSEDPLFITDFSDPTHPVGRSKQLSITIQQTD